MSTSKKPMMTRAEREYRLKSVIENSCATMADIGCFAMAVGKLLEAYAEDDISSEVMSSLVVGGLARGLTMAGIKLHTEVDAARSRSEFNA